MNEPDWGRLPDEVVLHLRHYEWNKRRRLKQRLQGRLAFPLVVNLKPPRRSSNALADLAHFQRFISAWREYPHADCVQWEDLNYRDIAQQRVPAKFAVADVATLARVLGTTEQQALQGWQERISRVLAEPFAQDPELQQALFCLLIDNLEQLQLFTELDLELLLRLIPQLHPGMGKGCFLRALPITYVDTKFLEQNYSLIEQIMDLLYAGEVLGTGGLAAWLNCQANPKGWLWVRPLCDRTRQALGGLPLMQLATDTLLSVELPARYILVVENVQSGLALPPLDDTIAVFGGGKNVSWMSASWLNSKYVGYWGDIDSEGFCILADAKRKVPLVNALMMDEQTVLEYGARMVDEPSSIMSEPTELTANELKLFRDLRRGRFSKSRLEQERVASEYIIEILMAWRYGRQR